MLKCTVTVFLVIYLILYAYTLWNVGNLVGNLWYVGNLVGNLYNHIRLHVYGCIIYQLILFDQSLLIQL